MFKVVVHDADGMLLRGERFSDAYTAEFGVDAALFKPFFEGPFQGCLVGRLDLKEELVRNGWLSRWGWKGTADELLSYWFSKGDELDRAVARDVAALRARGAICVLATNQEKYRCEFLREAHGLDTLFDVVCVSSEIGHRKPEAAFFDAMMSRVRRVKPAGPEEVLFWDDRPAYVEGGARYGFSSSLFTEAAAYASELRRQGLL